MISRSFASTALILAGAPSVVLSHTFSKHIFYVFQYFPFSSRLPIFENCTEKGGFPAKSRPTGARGASPRLVSAVCPSQSHNKIGQIGPTRCRFTAWFPPCSGKETWQTLTHRLHVQKPLSILFCRVYGENTWHGRVCFRWKKLPC
jgi:hypothetical protein